MTERAPRGRPTEPKGPSEAEQKHRPPGFPEGPIVFGEISVCHACKGKGTRVDRKHRVPCPACNGSGYRKEGQADALDSHHRDTG